MTTVINLIPGDLVTHLGAPPGLPNSAVYIAQTQHPLYRGLQLVIWRLSDGSISLDALRPTQDVGEVEAGPLGVPGDDVRLKRLREAIHGGPQMTAQATLRRVTPTAVRILPATGTGRQP